MAEGQGNHDYHGEEETPVEEREAESFQDASDTTPAEAGMLQSPAVEDTENNNPQHDDIHVDVQEVEAQSITGQPQTQDIREPAHAITESGAAEGISTAGMDEVPVNDELSSANAIPNPIDTAPTLAPSVELHEPSSTSPTKGLSGDLPAVDFPPPPVPPTSATSPSTEKPALVSRTPSEGIRGKMTSGFSWFSRATTMRKTSASPSRQPGGGLASRRGTASSVATLGSNPDNTLGTIRDERGVVSPFRTPSASLQDRFHAVRMEQETGEAGDGLVIPEGVEDPQSPAAATSEPTSPAPTMKRSESQNKSLTTVNSKLPPGTAAGMSVGPSPEDEDPVNWDLWQNLVYEGPAAMSKTSGEELNRAIQNGIPQPIRGVVWQVLANSRNEDLELLYRELVARGADSAPLKTPPLSRTESSNQVNGNGEKESLASSASSIKSQADTPATVHSPTVVTPGEGSSDTITKVKESLNAEKSRRLYDDAKQLDKLEKMIKRDLGARTSYSKFVASAGLQDGLFGICKAYAIYDEAVGYAQGMNFIAMPLLFNMPEEEAFTLFVRLMNKYDLRSMFTADMTGLHLRLYQFERLLEDFEPALYCHLHRRGVSPVLYATQWFLTLFAYRFPLQLVLRIYDLILSEGVSAILRFGIVLMQKNAQTLLAMKDMSQITTHLKEKLFDVYIDKSPSASSILESGFFGSTSGIDKEVYHADALVRDACTVSISPETLTLYTAEFEEKTRIERERETELEGLRTSNANFVTKVRRLEEAAQQHDAEHVSIASELVRTKVENESLSDMNESLKFQVDELRKMVESQPAEVEGRLKSEMERIMARNMEVQNANRALEDDMGVMEQELVRVKMESAQAKEENDALRQKLANIQAMIGGK